MNNADLQILSAIQKRPQPHDVALTQLAGIMQSLGQQVETLKEEMDATQDLVGDLVGRLQRIADSFAHIAYERAGKLPKPGKDFLPEGPEHFHTPDDGPCWGKECFTTVASEVA